MTLVDKIKTIYPELTYDNFSGEQATIFVQNDSDGKGDYITKWGHPTLPRPTEDELK
jgi:hypothetical protein